MQVITLQNDKVNSVAVIKGDSFIESFYESYSKFKHGSKTMARQFGKTAARHLTFEEGSSLVFYSAPYNNIPTASNAFKDYLLAFCAEQFRIKGIHVRQGKINREYSYDDDYGMMSKEDRKKAISSDLFHIDKTFITPQDTLVFIDDIKITGSHEERIRELLVREGIENHVIFVYLAEYTGSDPTIEHRLNHDVVNNLLDINEIIRDEEFIFNTRVVKYILKANPLEFMNFVSYQSTTFRETLSSLAILNGYHDNEKYVENFEALQTLL